jgi:lipopolysaccharide transport system permease protein
MNKIVVDTNKRSFSLNLKELFYYKDLLLILAYRDLRIRYSQTMLGIFWVLLQPILTLLIFTLVFGRFANVPTAGFPYPVFALCGMIPWTYFSFLMSQAGNSIISSQDMIKKIYFPRLIVPLSKSLVGLVDFGVAFLFLLALLVIYKIPISPNILTLPLFVFMIILSGLAIGIWLSALSIRYRDFQHISVFLVQLGLYVTPVAYPSEIVVNFLPEWVVILYYLNPVAGIVDGFRWAMLGIPLQHSLYLISFAMSAVLFVTGVIYFKRIEKTMADIV